MSPSMQDLKAERSASIEAVKDPVRTEQLCFLFTAEGILNFFAKYINKHTV